MTNRQASELTDRELDRFAASHPRSGELRDAAEEALLSGVPMNRGVLMTPFHMMALMSPATTESDVTAHTAVLRGFAAELTA
jgi:glutamate-1-semialdehyde aminotransferase